MLTKEKLQQDLKDAMRASDDVAKRTLRGLITAIKLAEVESLEEMDDDGLTALVMKEVKSRRETIEEAGANNRQDLVDSTQAEIDFLRGCRAAGEGASGNRLGITDLYRDDRPDMFFFSGFFAATVKNNKYTEGSKNQYGVFRFVQG